MGLIRAAVVAALLPQLMPFNITKGYKMEYVPRLVELERQCFEPGQRFTFSSIFSWLRGMSTWLAWDGREIAGFIIAGVVRKEASIETIDVAPTYRGQGIATQLITKAEEDFAKRGFRRVKLEVGVDNPAIILYFRLGYRVTQFKKDYYRKGQHSLKMVKKLKSSDYNKATA